MMLRLFLVPVAAVALFAGLIAVQVTAVVVPAVVRCVVPTVVRTVVPVVVDAVNQSCTPD